MSEPHFALLTADDVEVLHDDVLNPGELMGRARDKSLEGAIARVENRLAYGMIFDVFDLAAAYAAAVSQGHCFNDGNKRTAYRTMDAILTMNGVVMDLDHVAIGDLIIRLAQGKIDDGHLADWLRERCP
jgi:death on curing protein